MIIYSRGDVVLVKFQFSDGVGVKLRPALVLSIEDYHRNRQELIMVAITSNTECCLVGDTRLNDWKMGGLLYPSIVTAIIRTIKKDMVERKLGSISNKDLQAVEENLKLVMGFNGRIKSMVGKIRFDKDAKKLRHDNHRTG